jgi:hypothetical protein
MGIKPDQGGGRFLFVVILIVLLALSCMCAFCAASVMQNVDTYKISLEIVEASCKVVFFVLYANIC